MIAMQAALETLGCNPTYHGYVPLSKTDDCAKWTRAFEAKYHKRGPLFTREDWDDLLGDYQAVTDSPAICFVDELIEAYPEAKVVLVERDLESWHRSFEDMIQGIYSPVSDVLRILDPQLLRPLNNVYRYVYRDPQGFCRTDDKEELRNTARTLYRAHYEHVRRACPKDRLLEFGLTDGWDPLCEFLGKEKPDAPFPRVNEGAALAGKFKEVQKRSLLLILRNVTLGIVSVLMALFAVAWARR